MSSESPAAGSGTATGSPTGAGPDPWWRETAIYHIYPRSFQDSNGDGLGDLPGITRRLPYLQDLGVGAIWMGPIFASPQVDNGYDISDYRSIDPRFGSMDDLDDLIAAAHRRGIRVLLDLVFNHSSDQHAWFRSSVSDPAGPCGDYYIWRDAPAGRAAAQAAHERGEAQRLPNNWRSWFSGPAWSWSPERGQFYLHLFAPQQPDLNWANPRVRHECRDIANFWLARGVDGFRMDVINMIAKDPALPSIPVPAATLPGPGDGEGRYINAPALEGYLREFRSGLLRSRDVVLVGETPAIPLETAARLTDPAVGALDMVLLFDHLSVDEGPGGRWDPVAWDRRALARVLDEAQRALQPTGWPSLYTANHDQPRVVSRYGDDSALRRESATALAGLFFLQRGTPIIYQGDELAMANYPIASADDIVDIESGNALRDLVQRLGVTPDEALGRVARRARDNGRTPMQWDGSRHAGFTTGDPWFAVNPDYETWNAAAQTADERSVYTWFQRLLQLRHEWPALARGRQELLWGADQDVPVIAYRRYVEDEHILVIVNCSDQTVAVPPELNRVLATGELLLSNYPAPHSPARELQAWDCRVVYRSVWDSEP